MPIAPASDLLHAAASRAVAVSAFDVVHLELAEAVVAAAEETRLPVMLQLSDRAIRFHRGLDPLARAVIALAVDSPAHVAVQLDGGDDDELVRRAVTLGFGSVIFDGSALGPDGNAEATMRVVEFAHADDVAVEGVLASPSVADSEEAHRFVAETGIDVLGISLAPADSIAALHRATAVPLALRGRLGRSDEDISAAVAAGISKVDATALVERSFAAALSGHLAAHPLDGGPESLLGAARDAAQVEAVRVLSLFGSRE